LAEIDGERVHDWLRHKHQSGLNLAYCNAMAGVLRRLYNLAKRWNIPGGLRESSLMGTSLCREFSKSV
jgi:hypothetical protein